MVKAIIFDCFGVLYHGSLTHMYELVPPDRHLELKDLNHASDQGYITMADYASGVAELTGTHSVDDIERLIRADHIRNQPLVEYVRALKQVYTVGLLSNVGKGVVERLFSDDERRELFDEVVLSSVVGMVKPFPEIFLYTAARLGVAPGECLMIDDLSDNIEGARTAGMQGIVYHTTAQLQDELAQYGVVARA